MLSGYNNTFLGHNPHNKNNFAEINYGCEIWNINRQDYQQVLARSAEASNAKIMFDAETTSVDVDHGMVHLKDGRELQADVIIGADGMKSIVRRSIPALAHIEPQPHEEAACK